MKPKLIDQSFLMTEPQSVGLQITRSEGSYVFDNRGEKYIDFAMGWTVGNIGWGHEEIRAKILEAEGPAYVSPYYFYQPWAELAKLLVDITPGTLRKCFRATGGTEAVDIALQIAMLYKQRQKFVSIEGSFHGNSIGTISIASSAYRERYKGLLPNCRKISPPLDDHAADEVEAFLRKGDVAAFIMEPIICNLGVEIPTMEFMTRLRHLCTKYGTLLIFDEVAAGFGRTGKLFACEHFNIQPDILCLAKAITGGYAPLGATLITDKVANALGDDFTFWSTYGWHPLGVHAAIANITYIKSHKKTLLHNVSAMSNYFANRLASMPFKRLKSVHLKGLAIGVHFKKEGYGDKLRAKCQRAGLLVSGESSSLLMFPALNLDRHIAKEGLDILENCLD